MLQTEKAKLFRKQHASEKLLILPNIWDTLTAKLMASAGFESIATASVSVAAVNGYPDGEHIPLHTLLASVSKITAAVDLPVSVDFEKGYAHNNNALRENTKRLLDAGAVGINIEDGQADKKGLTSLLDQCKKIEVIRDTASQYGVDLFINARTDVYLQNVGTTLLADTIQRANAYQQAGADCFYPILINSYDALQSLISEVPLPVNVLLIKPLGDLKRLEQIGVRRVSLGPGTLKYMLTKIRNMVSDLRHYNTEHYFAEDLITNDDLLSLLK